HNVRGLHAFELNPGAEDDAGEAHAPDGGPKDFAVVLGRAGEDFTGGCEEAEIPHEVREGPVAVMVLAMNVGGDGASHGHELGARRHGQEETARQKKLNNL